MELMFDLQLLALQADVTRVITFTIGIDGESSNLVMPDSGTNKAFHALSHHGNQPAAIMEFNLINTHRIGRRPPERWLPSARGAPAAEFGCLDPNRRPP